MCELIKILEEKAGLVDRKEINRMKEKVNKEALRISIRSINKKNELWADVNKMEMIVAMEYLKNHFQDNNYVSTQMVELIPDALIIVCDDEKNATQDIPGVEVWTAEKKQLVKIRRNDVICWEIINKARGAI